MPYSQQAGNVSLKVTTDENLFEELIVEVENGKLWIKGPKNIKIKPTEMNIVGSSSTLTAVNIQGCMDFHNEGELKVDEVRFEVIGVGDIVISRLSAQEVVTDVSGVGDIHLSGQAEKGNYYLSGVGKIYAYDCQVEYLNAELSGVGSMQIRAEKKLTAEASGVGSIYYKGEAEVDASNTGVGKVKNEN